MTDRYGEPAASLYEAARRLDDASSRRASLEATVERHRLLAQILVLISMLEEDDLPGWFEPPPTRWLT